MVYFLQLEIRISKKRFISRIWKIIKQILTLFKIPRILVAFVFVNLRFSVECFVEHCLSFCLFPLVIVFVILYYSYFSTYHVMVDNVTNKWSTWDTCTISEKLINLQDNLRIVPLIYLYVTYCFLVLTSLYCIAL